MQNNEDIKDNNNIYSKDIKDNSKWIYLNTNVNNTTTNNNNVNNNHNNTNNNTNNRYIDRYKTPIVILWAGSHIYGIYLSIYLSIYLILSIYL
jgi:hypothetical protein